MAADVLLDAAGELADDRARDSPDGNRRQQRRRSVQHKLNVAGVGQGRIIRSGNYAGAIRLAGDVVLLSGHGASLGGQPAAVNRAGGAARAGGRAPVAWAACGAGPASEPRVPCSPRYLENQAV